MSVPTLRFKEFGESDFHKNAFKTFLIKDIANIQVGRDLKEELFSNTQTIEHSYPVYSNTVENRGLYGFYNFEEYDGNSLTVVGRGAGLGTAFARSSSFGAIGRLLVISPKNNEFKVHYFAEYVNFKLQIHNENGGIPQLPGSTFGMYSITLPSIDEQTKIANFLTAVDEKITQLTQKHDLLTQYKKGVMQQIFSQELRFKDDDGQDFPEWEVMPLSELMYEAGKKKVENPKDIELLTVKLHFKGAVRSGKYPLATEKGRPYYIRFASELIVGRQNLHNGGVAIVTEEASGCIASNAISSFKTKNNVSVKFVFLSMTNSSFISNVDNAVGGTGQKEISVKQLMKITLPTPCVKEQTKIANFLTSIDDKIIATKTQLQAVKQYKQGLLQQMFVQARMS